MRKLQLVTLALILAACGDGRLSPQGGTITSVGAGSGATGGGTSGAVTVNVTPDTGGGLSVTTDAISLLRTCGTDEVLKWSGTAWACGVAGVVDGSGTYLTMPLWTPDGTTLGNSIVTQSSGNSTNVAGKVYITGTTSSNHTSLYAEKLATGFTSDNKAAIWGYNYGTYDTTATDLYTYGVRGDAIGTKSAGGNDLFNWGVYGYARDSDYASGVEGRAYDGVLYTTGGAFRGDGGTTGSIAAGVYAQGDSTGGAGEVRAVWAHARNGSGLKYNFYGEGTAGIYNGGGAEIDGNTVLGDAATDTTTINGIATVQNFRGTIQTYSGASGNDFALDATATTLVITPTGNFSITGFTGGAAGREVTVIFNGPAYDIGVLDDNAGSTAANRIETPGNDTWYFSTNRSFKIVYDDVASRWRMTGFATAQFPVLVNNGALYQYGAATIGDAAGDAHSLTGTLNANSTAGTSGQVLTINGSGLPAWAAASGGVDQIISPSVSGALADWAPAGYTTTTTLINANATSNADITGLTGGTDGRNITICNTSYAGNVAIYSNNAGSIEANQFDLGSQTFAYLRAMQCATFFYNGTTTNWQYKNATTDASYNFTVVNSLGVSATFEAGAGVVTSYGDTTIGDSTSGDTHTINGTTTLNGATGGNGLVVTNSGTAQTGVVKMIQATTTSSQTFDVTAGARTAYGLYIDMDAIVDGGDITNPLTKYAIYASAGAGGGSGGADYALYADEGLVNIEGATTIDDTLYVTGTATFTSNLSVSGTTTVADATFSGIIKDSNTAPTISTCGTAPTVTGGSNAFRIRVGSGVTTACTATFAATKTNTPTCVAKIEDVAEDVYISALSATAITITAKTGTTDMASNMIDVICIGDA